MKTVNKTKQSFYAYLQEHYSGKLVAYSKKAKEVYATGKTAKELIKRLKEKKIDLKDAVFTGPIPQAGRTYVYFLPLFIKSNRGRDNS